MNFTCNECNDTGSRDKSGDYLDCGHCDAAMQRKALNDWLASQYHQGAIAKVDSMDAWAIHQRALAMAPKQEAPKVVTDDLAHEIMNSMAVHVGDWADGLDYEPSKTEISGKALCYILSRAEPATPAAANGALTDEDILTIIWKYSSFISVGNYSSIQFDCQTDTLNCVRAILAAAGPDAALTKTPEEVIVTDWPACNPGCDYEDPYGGMHDHRSKGCTCEAAKESIARQRAALSGAKGN